jgi:hypothetical protein
MPGYKPYTYPHPLRSLQSLPKPSTAVSEVAHSTQNNAYLNTRAGILDYIPGKVIRYTMPEPAMVRLSIHDMQGRTVAVPLNKKQPAGIHEFTLDSGIAKNRMAAGQYMYRLSIGNELFTVSKRSVNK